MISRPQGDFKHTGHIGLDGAFFGDVAFLDKYDQLPKQIVTPCKIFLCFEIRFVFSWFFLRYLFILFF